MPAVQTIMASGTVADSLAVVAMVRDAQEQPEAATSQLLLDCLDRLAGADVGNVIVRRPRGRRPTARLDGQTIYLSVSHSADMAAAAASLHPVGIDVERIRTVRNVDDVGAHIAGFMPQHYAGGPLPDSHAEVLGAWTRYEAAVKALGVGRAFVPSEFNCNPVQKITFRGLDLPLNLATAKLHKTGRNDHAGYLLSIAARTISHVVINHGSNLGYTPVNHERQES